MKKSFILLLVTGEEESGSSRTIIALSIYATNL